MKIRGNKKFIYLLLRCHFSKKKKKKNRKQRRARVAENEHQYEGV